MTTEKLTRLISRLEQGLIMDSERLKALDEELEVSLQDIRDFGRKQVAHTEWHRLWHQHVNNFTAALTDIRLQINLLDVVTESQDTDRADAGSAARESIQAADLQIQQSLDALRAQGTDLDADAQQEWQQLNHSLENHVKTIEACAETTQIKLEMLNAHSKEEVELALQNILSRLPDLASTPVESPEEKQQKLDDAAIELNHEQHKVIGLMGIIKAMFLWVENPSERVRKNEAAEPTLP